MNEVASVDGSKGSQQPITQKAVWAAKKAGERARLREIGYIFLEVLFSKEEKSAFVIYATAEGLSLREAIRKLAMEAVCRSTSTPPSPVASQKDGPVQAPRRVAAIAPAMQKASLSIDDHLQNRLATLKELHLSNCVLQKRRYYYAKKIAGSNYVPIKRRRPIDKHQYIEVTNEVTLRLQKGETSEHLEQKYRSKLEAFIELLQQANADLEQQIGILTEPQTPKTSPSSGGYK